MTAPACQHRPQAPASAPPWPDPDPALPAPLPAAGSAVYGPAMAQDWHPPALRLLAWTPIAQLARELAALARPEGPPPWARAGAGLGRGSILPGGGRKARRERKGKAA